MSMERNRVRFVTAFKEWMLVYEGIPAKLYSTEMWQQAHNEKADDYLGVICMPGAANFITHSTQDQEEVDDFFASFGFDYRLVPDLEAAYVIALPGYDFSRPKSEHYPDLLKDPRWLNKAKKVKARANYRCQDCGKDGYLEAHHCYYSKIKAGEGILPWEYPLSALRALCKACHDRRHVVEIRFRAILSTQSHDQIVELALQLGHTI